MDFSKKEHRPRKGPGGGGGGNTGPGMRDNGDDDSGYSSFTK